MIKIQITLTDEEANILNGKAADLGYDVTKYAKFILAKEAAEALMSIPVIKASSDMEKLIDQAIKEDLEESTKVWSLE